MANPSITVGTSERTYDSTARDALVNPYGARYATIADADAIDQVVKEAFGASAPKSSAARDIKRANTTYIVATKGRGDNGSFEHSDGEVSGGWSSKFRSIFSSSIGNSELEAIGEQDSWVGGYLDRGRSSAHCRDRDPTERTRQKAWGNCC